MSRIFRSLNHATQTAVGIGIVVIFGLIAFWSLYPAVPNFNSNVDKGKDSGSLNRTAYLIRLSRTCVAAAKYELALNIARQLVKRSDWGKEQVPLYRSYLLIAGIYRDWGRLDEMDIYVRLALDALNQDRNIEPKQRKRVWRQLQQMLREMKQNSSGVIEREA